MAVRANVEVFVLKSTDVDDHGMIYGVRSIFMNVAAELLRLPVYILMKKNYRQPMVSSSYTFSSRSEIQTTEG
jgi:hypothetical protein